jgi:curved DNA-binding protein CbpA
MDQITYDPTCDYYRLLRIDPEAGLKEIRAAYRAAMRRVHPDLNPSRPDSTAAAQELNHAYDVLSRSSLRSQYDGQRREYLNHRRTAATRSKARTRRRAKQGTRSVNRRNVIDEILARVASGLLNGLTSS